MIDGHVIWISSHPVLAYSNHPSRGIRTASLVNCSALRSFTQHHLIRTLSGLHANKHSYHQQLHHPEVRIHPDALGPATLRSRKSPVCITHSSHHSLTNFVIKTQSLASPASLSSFMTGYKLVDATWQVQLVPGGPMTTINGTVQQVKVQLAISNPDWKFRGPEVSTSAVGDFPVRFQESWHWCGNGHKDNMENSTREPSTYELWRGSNISKEPVGLGWTQRAVLGYLILTNLRYVLADGPKFLADRRQLIHWCNDVRLTQPRLLIALLISERYRTTSKFCSILPNRSLRRFRASRNARKFKMLPHLSWWAKSLRVTM